MSQGNKILYLQVRNLRTILQYLLVFRTPGLGVGADVRDCGCDGRQLCHKGEGRQSSDGDERDLRSGFSRRLHWEASGWRGAFAGQTGITNPEPLSGLRSGIPRLDAVGRAHGSKKAVSGRHMNIFEGSWDGRHAGWTAAVVVVVGGGTYALKIGGRGSIPSPKQRAQLRSSSHADSYPGYWNTPTSCHAPPGIEN